MNKGIWREKDVERTVRQVIIDKLGVDPKEISGEASLQEDLGADSLDAVEIIMDLEDKFGIQIPDKEAEKVSTVGDAINLVKELIGLKEE